MADDTFEQLQNNIKSDAVKTAQIAVDYLENDMLGHMEDLLECHLKKWKSRGFVPIYENPTKILIDRSAKSYKEAPKRAVTVNGEVSETQTELYNDLLRETNLNFIAQDLDARARLLRASLLLVQVDEESGKKTLSVLSRNNSDVVFNRLTGEMMGLIYTAGIVGLNGGQIFHIWAPDTIYDLEGDKIVGQHENPYGIIPAAVLNDTRPPLGALWKYPSWEQLIQLSNGVNLFNTEALFNSRYAMVGSPVTNMKIPEGMVTGIDTAYELDGGGAVDTPFFEFTSPTANVTEFMSWLKPFRETVADEWGVNLNFAGSGSADSGFKLIVEEFENIELRQTRIVSAKQFEEDLYQVFAAMSVVHDWGLDSEGRGVADFKEPALPVNKTEDWAIAKDQLALGVLSLEEYWLKIDPDLTPEQLAEKRRIAGQIQGLAATVPTFEA
jgi:hypothetical protein